MQFSWDSQGDNRKRMDLRFDCDTQSGRTTIHDLKSDTTQDFDSYDEAIQYLAQQQPQG